MNAWPHQTAAVEWCVDRFRQEDRGVLLAMPMGTGKSKVAIDLLCQHYAHQQARQQPVHVLVVCPLSVAMVWPRELKRHCTVPYQVAVDNPQGFAYNTIEYPEQLNVLVMHYDAAWREPVASWLLKRKWNFIVADESHRFKAIPRYHKTLTGEWEATEGKLAAFMADLGRRGAFRLALTGTPMAHSPVDIYSQFRFLDAGKRFGNSGWKFQQTYCRYGGYQQHAIVGYQHQDQMSRLYNEIAWTCPPDVVELPDAVHETREFDLSPKAQKVYQDMWSELVARVEEGEITAANGAVAFLRLQQITSGVTRLEDGTEVTVDTGKAKLLEEFLNDIPKDEKTVVFCAFRHDLATVRAAAKASGRRYGEISGAEKSGLDAHAELDQSVDLAGVQIQAGGVGIDLTRARYAVYFSPGLSLANYEQSLKRLHRPGQSRPVTFLHFNARGTVDEALYKRLEDRKDLVEGILSLARECEDRAT